jgi:chromate reductase
MRTTLRSNVWLCGFSRTGPSHIDSTDDDTHRLAHFFCEQAGRSIKAVCTVTLHTPTILLICGSLRAGSSNLAALTTAQALVPAGSRARMYEGLAQLPHFNPDLEQHALPAAVLDLRAQLAAADGVLFSTPEYAGSLPGSFKNLLDWCVGEGLYQKPVGWINPSPHAEGAARSYELLGVVLGYVNADRVEAACVRAGVRRDAVGVDGQVHDPAVRRSIGAALRALVEHVRARSVTEA